MRFTIREGTDPVAGADGTMLAAMGLPGGGVVAVGRSHLPVRPTSTAAASALLLGPEAMGIAAVRPGEVVEVKRAMLAPAHRVVLAGEELPAEPRVLVDALRGRPLTTGDVVTVDVAHGTEAGKAVKISVIRMEPVAAGLVGDATRFVSEGDAADPAPVAAAAGPQTVVPSTAEALLAGLDMELEVLSGWLELLTSARDLPAAWGLPQVAGVILEGPPGCGKSELVAAAAARAGAAVHEVDLNLIFKPERLLDVLEKSVKLTATPGVVFVDRLEAVAGDEGLAPFRTQVGAILRWFLDAVSERPRLACVLGVAAAAHLDATIVKSSLLPRTLSIPPPDLERRRLLFQAALARVPTDGIDYERLAARSAGFSGSDVLAAVVHASAMVARSGDPVTAEVMAAAVEETTPTLGAAPIGEIPSYGFDKVADLKDVKQRLTEAVIWPMTDPERFARMGIEPPRGILLHGPPGTGKTFVVRALAHESGAAFFPIKGAELLDKFVGESERGVREVFARARTVAPAILFFDEIDALAPVRGRSTTSVTDSVVAALLTELDGVAGRGDVVVIGATNRPDLIDPALLRTGRFEVHIELELPGVEARRALLDITDVPFASDVDLDELARRTEGLSFADLTGLLREAALNALRVDATALAVDWPQLEEAIRLFASRAGG